MNYRLFNNKPNTVHHIEADNKVREIWESRSAAVVAIVIGINEGKKYVLIEKRSKKMPDAPGKWVVPGGYIDYNENGWDCFRRELYEETKFLVDHYKNYILFDNDEQPFFVKTEPDENRQNIALNYCAVIKFNKHRLMPRTLEGDGFEHDEVDFIKWLPIEQLDDPKYDWAFEHNKRIKMALTKYNSEKWKIRNILKRLRILITLVK